ncbi:MAG: hypothetical protein WC986_13580 [Elusimicrobiota bacterium]
MTALIKLFGQLPSMEPLRMAREILEQASLARVRAALEHPQRGRRWASLETLHRFLDDALALVPDEPDQPAPPAKPSGLVAAIAEDSSRWDDYCREQDRKRQQIREEYRRRFSGSRCASFDVVQLERSEAA